jgi:predicted  nucleic acid-binding Zn-ribbon protein
MGASKEILISSAERYLGILKQEEDRFEQAVRNQRSKVVDDKQTDITNLEQVIQDKEKQIAQLNSEIAEAHNEINQMKEEVALGQAKILQTQTDFRHTYQHLIGQLQSDVKKIKQHLE